DHDVGAHREALAETEPETALAFLDHLAESRHHLEGHALAEFLGEEIERDLDLEFSLVGRRHAPPQAARDGALAADDGKESQQPVEPVDAPVAEPDEHGVAAAEHGGEEPRD